MKPADLARSAVKWVKKSPFAGMKWPENREEMAYFRANSVKKVRFLGCMRGC